MIKNDFGKLYIGISEIIHRRIYEHNGNRGASFTKGKAKFKLVFKEGYQTIAAARKREMQIKKWRRSKKEMLIKRYEDGLPTKTECS